MQKTIKQCALALQDTDQILTPTLDASLMNVLLTLNVPQHWPVRMRNVLILANVQGLLIVLQETIVEYAHVNLATLVIRME
jgi:hypothetical protein